MKKYAYEKKTRVQIIKHKRKVSRIVRAVCFLVVLAIAAVTCYKDYFVEKEFNPDSEGIMRVSYVDVGQGDCELIEYNGKSILIDGGEAATADFVVSFLKSRGIKKLDYYIVSHPHADHMGAASVIIDAFPVDNFITTQFSELNMPTSRVFENMLESLERQKSCNFTTVEAGDVIKLDELTMNILAPFEESSDYNNMSVVVRFDYGDTRFLFTGDAEKEVEEQLLNNNSDVKADVLKVGHHGSRTSTSADFLKAVSPKYAVISCGVENSYGHPHKETTELLKRCAVSCYRTDESGTIVFYSDSKRVYTETKE